MRAALQRVSRAAVEVDGKAIGQIGLGWLVLLGVGHADTEPTAVTLADKAAGLRCFEDAQGKTNLAAADVGAAWLGVSQITLFADVSRGRRPGFTAAAPPAQAEALVERFAARLNELGFHVEHG